MANIYTISGPCGCGKSTLTDALAMHMVKVEKRRQVYVIHGDDFHQGFVTRAYEEGDFWADGQATNQLEWLEILKFNWECIISVAGKALARGLDVLIDYIVEEELPLLQKLAKDHDAKLYYLVLTASEETITKRIQERGDMEMVERALFLKNKLDHLPENQGHLYDNTGKTVKQEVLEVLQFMKEACAEKNI
ncbi:MAG: AAA family ATPase [Lachnospiraceae bacterium]|nr:AAA family ATPase [Lachnospiraceae bacterium]